MELDLSLMKSYRQQKITFYDKISFFYPPVKFEQAADLAQTG